MPLCVWDSTILPGNRSRPVLWTQSFVVMEDMSTLQRLSAHSHYFKAITFVYYISIKCIPQGLDILFWKGWLTFSSLYTFFLIMPLYFRCWLGNVYYLSDSLCVLQHCHRLGSLLSWEVLCERLTLGIV